MNFRKVEYLGNTLINVKAMRFLLPLSHETRKYIPRISVLFATFRYLPRKFLLLRYIKEEKFSAGKNFGEYPRRIFFRRNFFFAEIYSTEIYSAEIMGLAEIFSAEIFGCPICRKAIILDGLTFSIFNEPLQSKHARLEYSSSDPWTNRQMNRHEFVGPLCKRSKITPLPHSLLHGT